MTETPSDVPEFEALNLLNFGTETDMVDAAKAYSMAAMPEWEPRAGNTEVVLMEALAVMLGPEILAVELLPGRIVEHLMRLYGVSRHAGAPVWGRVRFTVTNSAATQVIPAGTRLRLGLPATGETVDFLTAEAVSIITTESLTGEVDVYAEYLGTVGNFTPVDTTLDLVDSLPFVEAVKTINVLGGGKGEEADQEFNGRASATLARLTSTLVLPESFQYAAGSRIEVGRAKVIDLYNPATPETNPAVGHVTVAVAGLEGEVLAPAVTAEIEGWLATQALASLAVHVIDPTYTTANIAVTVKGSFGYSVAQVQASVQAELTAWLSPKTWDWNPVVSQYAIVSRVAAAPGVDEVTSAPASIPLAGKAPLAVAGTITVTVI